MVQFVPVLALDAGRRRGRRQLRSPARHQRRAAVAAGMRRRAAVGDAARRTTRCLCCTRWSRSPRPRARSRRRRARRCCPGWSPRERFPRAVTISSTNQALAFATGPALGGARDREGRHRRRVRAVPRAGRGGVRRHPVLRAAASRQAARRAVSRCWRSARGCRSCGSQPVDPRLHVARHVRGDLRRRHRAAADLRQRHLARRARAATACSPRRSRSARC